MRRSIFAVSLGLVLLAARAHAVTITLSAPGAPVLVGSVVEVDVLIAGPGLGNFTAPSVRSFDFDVSFDPDELSFLEVEFDVFLGTPGTQAFVDSGEPAPGTVDLAAVSILSSATLNALQPDAFRLATIRFEALEGGTSALALTQTLVGDTSGAALAVDEAIGASVTVVPEPRSAGLVATGLLLAALGARPRRVG
jgi:hypothetical protein